MLVTFLAPRDQQQQLAPNNNVSSEVLLSCRKTLCNIVCNVLLRVLSWRDASYTPAATTTTTTTAAGSDSSTSSNDRSSPNFVWPVELVESYLLDACAASRLWVDDPLNYWFVVNLTTVFPNVYSLYQLQQQQQGLQQQKGLPARVQLRFDLNDSIIQNKVKSDVSNIINHYLYSIPLSYFTVPLSPPPLLPPPPPPPAPPPSSSPYVVAEYQHLLANQQLQYQHQQQLQQAQYQQQQYQQQQQQKQFLNVISFASTVGCTSYYHEVAVWLTHTLQYWITETDWSNATPPAPPATTASSAAPVDLMIATGPSSNNADASNHGGGGSSGNFLYQFGQAVVSMIQKIAEAHSNHMIITTRHQQQQDSSTVTPPSTEEVTIFTNLLNSYAACLAKIKSFTTSTAPTTTIAAEGTGSSSSNNTSVVAITILQSIQSSLFDTIALFLKSNSASFPLIGM